MTPYPRLLLGLVPALIASQLALAGAGAPEPGRFSGAEFDAASPDGQILWVLSALEARDRALGNFRYQLRESCTNVNLINGSRRFMQRSEYEMRRMDARLWMHLALYKFGDKAGEVDREWTVSWDGKVGVSLGSSDTASVGPAENYNFVYRKFNALLGLRIQVDDEGVPLARFLRTSLDRGSPVAVERERRNGAAKQVKVQVWRENERWAFWLDTDHGNMISRLEYRYQLGPDYMASHEEVLAPI